MFGGSTCGQHVANICTQLSMCGDHGLVGIIVWQLGAAVGHYWVVALVHLFVQNVVKCDIFNFYWDSNKNGVQHHALAMRHKGVVLKGSDPR